MKCETKLWQFVGFAVVSFLGTILHFIYNFTGSTFAALFSGVNESTWEHMKLMFFPMFIFAIVQSFFVGKEYDNFWCIKLRGILLGMVLIPIIFYTYNGVFGKSSDWINISIFFAAAAMAYIYETKQFKKGSIPCKSQKWAFIALCLIAVIFFVFTFIPPQIPLFQDPISGTYGLQK